MSPRKHDTAKDKATDKATDNKDSSAVVSVNLDDFTRTRDSVIVSLATLQSAVSDLSKAYINHANTILNRGDAGFGLNLPTSAVSNLQNGILGTAAAAAGGQQEEDQPKRKKRKPDPNAPKRALTPYFLFMQHMRGQIGSEMGKDVRPKDVSDEGARRWGKMGDQEKRVWKDLYADNLAIYQARMKAYKAGEPVPNTDDVDVAKQLQQGVQTAAAAEEEEEEGEAKAESEEGSSSSSESSESEREPTPPRSNKRRHTTAAGNAATPKAAPATEPSSSAAKKPSPEKKRKGKAAAAAEEKEKAEKEKADKGKRGAAAAAAPTAVETPKSDKKKKKRKSGAVDE